MRLVVLRPALTNRALPPLRWNSTRFLARPRRKCRPVMTSVPPTFRLFGVTLAMVGGFTAALAAAGTASAPSAATTAAPRSFRRVRDRVSIDPDIGARGTVLSPERWGEDPNRRSRDPWRYVR